MSTVHTNKRTLPPLANVSWSAFQSTFCGPCKFTTSEMMPMAGCKLAVET